MGGEARDVSMTSFHGSLRPSNYFLAGISSPWLVLLQATCANVCVKRCGWDKSAVTFTSLSRAEMITIFFLNHEILYQMLFFFLPVGSPSNKCFSLLPDPWTYKKVSGKNIEIGTFSSSTNVPNVVCITRAHHVMLGTLN